MRIPRPSLSAQLVAGRRKLSSMDSIRVLVLGGYGFFGRRLVERLVLQPGLQIIIAGRSATKGRALVLELTSLSAASPLSSCVLDADDPDLAQELSALRPHVVVHTAGPFQGQDYRVARACIAAGAHYIDLADGRAFVVGIGALDEDARAAGVAVLSGASSVPALSSAVVDEFAAGMQVVECIDIGISPGNRTERGLSTVQSVLSYCGRVIETAGAQSVFGWCGTWRQEYPGPVGNRLLSPCDVPDLALLPTRYPGRPRVRFGAGLELRFLHRGINAMAWLARRGWVAGWERHATRLKWASEWFKEWGTDAGAMHVHVRGRDARGNASARQWTLVAQDGDGPYVPTFASAALVTRLASGGALQPGARPCVGCLTSAEILAQARDLAITAGETGNRGLFEHAMGPAYERLDPAVRAFHDLAGTAELHGEVETEEPASALGALISSLLGAPRLRSRGALRFELRVERDRQTWTRHFPHRTMYSSLRLHDKQVVETLGPVRLAFALKEEAGTLIMGLRSMRFLGIPCPRWLLPHIDAREHGCDGHLHFQIRASLPWVGRVTGYRGWLKLPGHA